MYKQKNILKATLGQSRMAFLLVGAFSLFINLSMLIAPIYMLQVYDRVLTSHSVDTLIMLSVLAVSLLTLSALVDVARARILVRVGVKIDRQLHGPLFSTALQRQLHNAGGSLSAPIRDLSTVRTFLTGSGLIALFDAPWTPIYLLLIFMFHPLLGLIALAGAIVLLLMAVGGEFLSRGPLGQAGISSRETNSFLDRLARNADALHAMGMVKNMQKRWSNEHETGIAWQAIASDRAAVLNSGAKLIRMLLQIAVLGVGAWLVLQQAITPGVMIATSIIMGRALAPVQSAISGWRGIVESRAAYHRLSANLSSHEFAANHTRLPAPEGQIRVDGLVYKPDGASETLLKSISFDLKIGQSLGLIGPSGAGKSTLARLLVGIIAPGMGSVRLDGVEISQWPRADIGPYLGYLPQDVELLDGTVAQNIARFGDPDDEQIVKAAKLSGAHDLILALPDGYDTKLGRNAHILSGGQKQRIGLARAVYGDAQLIVLDEPNASLDAAGETALRETLRALKRQGRTVVVISHKPSILSSVDKMLMLDEGRVALFGHRDDVLEQLSGQPKKSTSQPYANDSSDAVKRRAGAAR